MLGHVQLLRMTTTASQRRYWLVKSEPSVFSFDDLLAMPGRTTHWDGVRNYQARNFMQAMQVGDLVLFYHSNANPPGVAGIAKVTKVAHVDKTAFDKKDHHFDAKSNPENPRWHCVDVGFVEAFATFVPLDDLKTAKVLSGMLLLSGKALQLSIQPVDKKHFDAIVKMGKA